MSSTHPESLENRGVTNDYIDDGWNLKQRRLMLIIWAAVWMIVGLKGCTNTKANQGEQTPAQSMPAQVVPENSQPQ